MSISQFTVPDPVPGLIDNRSINLLVGSSTAGKTALALTEFDNYLAGGSFMGFSRLDGQEAAQCGLITCSDTLGDFYRKVRDMQLSHCSHPVTFPIVEWPNRDEIEDEVDTYARLCEELSHCARQPIRFLLVENFQQTMKSTSRANESKTVNSFYRDLKKMLTDKDVALLGTVGQGKAKLGDRYAMLSEYILGSTAWSVGANSLIGVEYVHSNIPQGRRPSLRRITVQPASGKPSEYYADFTDEGKLQRTNSVPSDDEASADDQLDALLDAAEDGKEFSRAELIEWGAGLYILEHTINRWIKSRSDPRMGMIEKTKRGGPGQAYRKPSVQ